MSELNNSDDYWTLGLVISHNRQDLVPAGSSGQMVRALQELKIYTKQQQQRTSSECSDRQFQKAAVRVRDGRELTGGRALSMRLCLVVIIRPEEMSADLPSSLSRCGS